MIKYISNKSLHNNRYGIYFYRYYSHGQLQVSRPVSKLDSFHFIRFAKFKETLILHQIEYFLRAKKCNLN